MAKTNNEKAPEINVRAPRTDPDEVKGMTAKTRILPAGDAAKKLCIALGVGLTRATTVEWHDALPTDAVRISFHLVLGRFLVFHKAGADTPVAVELIVPASVAHADGTIDGTGNKRTDKDTAIAIDAVANVIHGLKR